MPGKIDLTNRKFGYLTALKDVGRDKRSLVLWECRCVCGKKYIVNSNKLLFRPTISCGCKKYETIGQKSATHRLSHTKFHRVWQSIRERCLNKNSTAYKSYGGRGILPCEEWLEFENFRKDMQESYLEHSKIFGEKNTTIERINVDLGYSKDNCRWATKGEQSRNKRSNLFYTYNNEVKILKDWCRFFGKRYLLVYDRIKKQGQSFEIAMELK